MDDLAGELPGELSPEETDPERDAERAQHEADLEKRAATKAARAERRAVKMQEQAALQEKRRKALELRKAGIGYATIAAQLGYESKSGAYKAVQVALKDIVREPAEELIKINLSRLEQMIAYLWPAVQKGSTPAIEKVLAIMDREARMLGTDAPRRIDLTATLRDMAVKNGLDPDEALAEADDIIKSLFARGT